MKRLSFFLNTNGAQYAKSKVKAIYRVVLEVAVVVVVAVELLIK